MTPFTILVRLITISRPRFWTYTVGPYLIGYASQQNLTYAHFVDWTFWYGLFFFMLPANILMYGINDLCDRDTDVHNEKKSQYETKIDKSELRIITYACVGSVVSVLPLVFFGHLQTYQIFILSTFLILSIIYSVPPIRFKSRPYLDSASNLFYALPGVYGYLMMNTQVEMEKMFVTFVAASCWTAALHLFSAIPDIYADQKAGLETTATRLGKDKSLIACAILWGTAATIAVSILGPIAIISVVYPLIPLITLIRKTDVFKTYTYLPWINLLVGFLLFWYLILTR